ncbi:hypothetical protein ABZP36_031222 [Zizania latifolia]
MKAKLDLLLKKMDEAEELEKKNRADLQAMRLMIELRLPKTKKKMVDPSLPAASTTSPPTSIISFGGVVSSMAPIASASNIGAASPPPPSPPHLPPPSLQLQAVPHRPTPPGGRTYRVSAPRPRRLRPLREPLRQPPPPAQASPPCLRPLRLRTPTHPRRLRPQRAGIRASSTAPPVTSPRCRAWLRPLWLPRRFPHRPRPGCWRQSLRCSPTELSDGILIAMSLNHGVIDGYTFWHMFNTWSEIGHVGSDKGSHELSTPPPVLERWVVDGFPVLIPLPFAKLEDTQLLLVHCK